MIVLDWLDLAHTCRWNRCHRSEEVECPMELLGRLIWFKMPVRRQSAERHKYYKSGVNRHSKFTLNKNKIFDKNKTF